MSNASGTPYTVTFYPSLQQAEPPASNWRNRPQSQSMAAGSLILMSGGMNMALGLGWNMTTSVPTTLHFQFCWFIGVIVGAVVAAPLITFLQKRLYMIISGLLVLTGGIIFVSVPYNYDAIVAARYINGMAIGFATVPFLVHASEVGAQSYRGSCLSIEQYSISFGIAIQVIYASQWTEGLNFAANRVHGIFSIVFGFFAVIAAQLAIVESPIFYLRKSDDMQALECRRLLTNPSTVTNATKAELEEEKSYVVSNEQRGFMASFVQGLRPLIKLMLYRGLLAFTFSLPLSLSIVWASYVGLGYTNNWVPIVYGVLRLLGSLIAIWVTDGIGRKPLSLLSLLVVGGFALGIGGLYNDAMNLLSAHEMSTVCTLLLLSQFFAGLYAPSTSIYLGEAFPMLVKPYFIAFCVVIQQVVPIIGICTFAFDNIDLFDYFISIGVIMCALFLVFCVVMPETRDTTLREAQEHFRRWFHFKCY